MHFLQLNAVEIFAKSVQLLAYVDYMNIIAVVSSAISWLDKKTKDMDLVVNEDKTKYFMSLSKQSSYS